MLTAVSVQDKVTGGRLHVTRRVCHKLLSHLFLSSVCRISHQSSSSHPCQRPNFCHVATIQTDDTKDITADFSINDAFEAYGDL